MERAFTLQSSIKHIWTGLAIADFPTESSHPPGLTSLARTSSWVSRTPTMFRIGAATAVGLTAVACLVTKGARYRGYDVVTFSEGALPGATVRIASLPEAEVTR